MSNKITVNKDNKVNRNTYSTYDKNDNVAVNDNSEFSNNRSTIRKESRVKDEDNTRSAETSTIQKQSFSTDPRPDGGNKVVSEESGDRVKNEEDSFAQIVGKYSACGVCQGAFSGRGAPVEESDQEFDGEKLYAAVHPECKDGPVQVYVLKREQEKDKPELVESKRLIEIPARYTDSAKEAERKARKEDRE